MLWSLTIFCLGLFLPGAYTTGTINLRHQPGYLQENEKSSINYTTCEVNDLHDEEDYEGEDYEGEVCHFAHYKEKKTIEEEFPGVRSCCPFHGHISSAKNCEGRDKDGNQAVFNKVEVCVKPNEEKDHEIAERVGTNLSCNKTILKDQGTKEDLKDKLSTINNVTVLRVGQKTYTDFCFGIKCDGDDSYFEYRYEACDEFEIEEPLGNGTRCCGKIRITELSIICITLTILQARTETFFMSRYPMRR